MLFADSVAKLAQLPVCPFVAPVAVIVYEVHGIEDNVIMAVSLVLPPQFLPFLDRLLPQQEIPCSQHTDFLSIRSCEYLFYLALPQIKLSPKMIQADPL